jgi:23S rRNA pseudouridine2605 synthase
MNRIRKKLRASPMTDEQRPPDLEPASFEDQLIEASREQPGDPIGDETDGEAHAAAREADEPEAESEEAEDQLAGGEAEETETGEAEDEDEPEAKPRPPAKLERLQKILAQSGVASRRKAEEMIEQGRVQVNGKVVTELGTKADAGRDHIRVDGKLLHGAERLRYFVLNKPRGFVTTVKDPEGRPTVMQFFDKLRERLYPVGRLDYQSEGLLLVTNDGELANRLTRAAAGVEKTYLVKVAGIPSESELDILRAGVAIEKGKPGSEKVRTSPARIRQVRQGDNPWYEVVLIEGRNRELRKMFEEVGHFVEKIRRVGYGPLILDQEPGNFRELDDNELTLLRKAADGTLKTPKAKDIRRRNRLDSLPPEKPASKARTERPAAGPKDYQPKKAFGVQKTFAAKKTFGAKKDFGAGKPFEAGKKFAARKPFDADRQASSRPASEGAGVGRPGRSSDEQRPDEQRPRSFGSRPPAGRGAPARPAWKKPEGQARSGVRPDRAGFKDRAGSGDRPGFKKPSFPRPEATRRPPPEPIDDDLEPRKPTRLHIEPVQDTERSARPASGRPGTGRPSTGRPVSSGYGAGRPPAAGRSRPPRAASSGRPPAGRPFRSEGGPSRAAFTSNGKPRAGGARPSSKPGRAAGRPFPAGAAGGETRPDRNAGGGWKPRPAFGGKRSSGPSSSGPRTSGGKAGDGDRTRPRPGGFAKPGSARPGSPRPSSARPSSPRPGSARPGSARPSFSKPAFKKSAHKPGGSGAKRGGPRPGGNRRG